MYGCQLPFCDVPKVETEDLIDSPEVAALLGLSHYNSVSEYRRRYDDFPEPVVEKGRCLLGGAATSSGGRRRPGGDRARDTDVTQWARNGGRKSENSQDEKILLADQNAAQPQVS